MKIALCSDEPYPIHDLICADLEARKHKIQGFGSFASKRAEPWVECTLEAARAVARGECEEGVYFCYTGTGACIAANKIAGIRAALCVDAETARNARIWNHANVLVLSNRLISAAVCREILDVWFATDAHDPRGADAVQTLSLLA